MPNKALRPSGSLGQDCVDMRLALILWAGLRVVATALLRAIKRYIGVMQKLSSPAVRKLIRRCHANADT